jgi:serine/threonine protein kinase
VTKIQKNKRAIGNELYISELVRKNIKGYVRFFAPVINHCDVHIKKDLVTDLAKCPVFKDDNKEQIAQKTSYVSMKTRYVGKKDLRDELEKDIIPAKFPQKIRKIYSYLLHSVNILYEHTIVHFDLKSNNIIMDSERNVPIIIDFGQSWSISQLNNPKNASEIFFIFSQYDYWCIDILICSYIMQEMTHDFAKTNYVTEQGLNMICNVFIYRDNQPADKIKNDIFLYSVLQTPQKQQEFRHNFMKSMANTINKRTWWELYEELTTYANTWDGYSLAVIHMNTIDNIYLKNKGLYDIIQPKLSGYIKAMEDVLYSIPSERPTPKITLGKINAV